ncbi:hypothetical protein FNV43_RR02102 [Rhamnella rubrinervis]|uniref:Uncharacterized protein n=1 Tax=Rhamnella rubrinervis TaxID=2594499 RepID=A0A8K0MTG9_9ROSA|nr:hypothetical protein FNV43_RR02102 [Rhamnella rubrinervis]
MLPQLNVSNASINRSSKTHHAPTSGCSDTTASATPTHWMREYFSPLPDAVPPCNLENQNSPLRDTAFPSALEDHNNYKLEESGDAELRYACAIASAIYDDQARLLKFKGSKSCKDRETFEKLEKVQDELYENFCKWKALHI